MARIYTKPNPGGYVNIKLGGINLYGVDHPVLVKGIHERVAEAIKTGKLICVSDFYTDDANSSPSSPVIITEKDDEGSFSGYFSFKPDGFSYLYISTDDNVTAGYAPFKS